MEQRMPQRERISLDGTWEFRKSETDPSPKLVPVPGPWQAVDELKDFSGLAWYSRGFTLPGPWIDGNKIILGFGAVDYLAEVWVNGQKAGEHEGGYLPFELDITSYAVAGQNSLVVKVSDPPEIFAEIPHGKQSWYGMLSGIWQSVWLEKRSASHLRTIKIIPSLDGRVQVRVGLSSELLVGEWLKADISAPDAASPLAEVVANCVEFELQVDHPNLWSVDSPNLYRLSVAWIDQQGQLHDELSDWFGFRSFTAREGKLWLNEKPIYLRGALDQDYYPDLICTPPSQEYIEAEFRQAKAMGLNCLRVHIKIADPRYYRAADKIGLLIWSELPSCQKLTPRSGERLRQTMQDMVMRDWNHPSIVIWSIINESWGIDLNEAEQRQWLLESYAELKQLDPYRLVVDNSACLPNFHLHTDIEDFHHYRQIPDHRHEWDEFVDGFSHRPAWTFSSFGDARRTGEEPIVLSEFGNWGLPDAARFMTEGLEPWWFESGKNWLEGVVSPHGIMQRFIDNQLEQIFGSWQEFIRLTQQQEYFSLKYEIESILSHPTIRGYVITEFTDVQWESNGLLDVHRNPKSFAGKLPTIIADTVIIPRWGRTAYWSGEKVEIEILLAHHADQPLPATSLHWDLPGKISGELHVAGASPGDVLSLGKIAFHAPPLTQPCHCELSLRLTSPDGTALASNALPLLIFPSQRDLVSAPLLWSDNPDWCERLSALGYNLTANRRTAGVILRTKLDEPALADLQVGARMLLVVNQPEDMIKDVLPVQVVEKEGSVWQGDWVSAFTWLNHTGPFMRLPGDVILGYAFEHVIPRSVLVGFKPHEFRDQVLAGTFVGWLHKNAAVLAKLHVPAGKLLVTTFRLAQDSPHADPVATILLDAMIETTANL
jgi:hypothetical protein